MYKLNKPATRVFNNLLNSLQDRDYLKLQSEGFMPLTVERVASDIKTPWGTAFLVSIAHYYEQNGDLMRDPEMIFIVIDKRQHQKDFHGLFIFPQLYQQDNIGIYEESVSVEEGKLSSFTPRLQRTHTEFANQWLRNILMQGF